MDDRDNRALQSLADGSLATVVQAQGITTNQGGFVQAGRNVNIQHHYHTLPQSTLNILDILHLVPNLRAIHEDILAKATPGTVIWFLKTKNFLLWLEADGKMKILWGTGIPGAGKSVMASIVIHHLESLAAANGRICVAYIYFRYSDAASLTVRSVLEILVKQTVERHPNCAMLAEQAYGRHLREQTQPSEAELLHLLHQFTKAMEITFHILDALDEAPEHLQVILLEKLTSLNVQLFVTSRTLRGVEARLPETCSFHIVAQEGDLDLHINREIANTRDLKGLLEGEPSFTLEVISLIKKNCAGMFLHASLQLKAIRRCTSMHDVIQTLEGFPSEIDAVYQQTWRRICQQTPQNVSLAKTIFIWVLTAARPMTVDELRHAIATAPDTHKFERKRLIPIATMLTLCCGLVAVEEETELVRLVHHTAQGALEELLREDFPHPHSLLAAVCMTHLAVCQFQNTTMASEKEYTTALYRDPLLAYASHAWAIHTRQSLDVPGIKRQTADFISNCESFPSFIDPSRYYEWDVLGPLHVLAAHYLPLSLAHGENLGDPNVTTQTMKETPLILASWHGNEGMVRDLLCLPDTQVNYLDRDGTSALMLAAEEGHTSIVNMLLARPEIQANLVDIFGRAALVSAAEHGHEGVVSALLAHHDIRTNLMNSAGMLAPALPITNNHRVSLNLPFEHPNNVNRSGWTALMVAASKGRVDVVKILLEHPEIDINLVDDKGRPAISRVAAHGYESIVRLFLAHPKIQVNVVDDKGWPALVLAIANGHEETVKSLLAHPDIDVNLANNVDGSGWAAIMEAAQGHEGILNLLLARHDIEVNLVDSNRESALLVASRQGHEGIAKRLLAHPKVQVNLVNINGWPALMLATTNGHEGMVKLLLAHFNIDVNAANTVDGSGGTALMEATFRGHEGIVKLLLARPEIQINSVDNNGWSALVVAAAHGCESIVQLLLGHPEIQVNAVDNEGWSALMWAANEGCIGITKLLLACFNIQANQMDYKGRSALWLAARNGLEGIVKLLLTHPDIQVHMADNKGFLPLMAAAYYGFEGALSALLAHPDIDINAVNDNGLSALMWASFKGREGIVRLLLAYPGIHVNSVDNEGRSMLWWAENAGHQGCVTLLTTFLGTQVHNPRSWRELTSGEEPVDDSSPECSDTEFYDAEERLDPYDSH